MSTSKSYDSKQTPILSASTTPPSLSLDILTAPPLRLPWPLIILYLHGSQNNLFYNISKTTVFSCLKPRGSLLPLKESLVHEALCDPALLTWQPDLVLCSLADPSPPPTALTPAALPQMPSWLAPAQQPPLSCPGMGPSLPSRPAPPARS